MTKTIQYEISGGKTRWLQTKTESRANNNCIRWKIITLSRRHIFKWWRDNLHFKVLETKGTDNVELCWRLVLLENSTDQEIPPTLFFRKLLTTKNYHFRHCGLLPMMSPETSTFFFFDSWLARLSSLTALHKIPTNLTSLAFAHPHYPSHPTALGPWHSFEQSLENGKMSL